MTKKKMIIIDDGNFYDNHSAERMQKFIKEAKENLASVHALGVSAKEAQIACIMLAKEMKKLKATSLSDLQKMVEDL